jgi:hypothetical protein
LVTTTNGNLHLDSKAGAGTYINYYNSGNTFLNSNGGMVGIGTVSPSSALDVRGVLSTSEIAFRNGDGGDDTDPYRLRKVRTAGDQNWLELQLNDNPDESFRIYGNSCLTDGCGAYSTLMFHSFDASGNAYHKGNLGIGVINPTEKLSVNGNIRSKEVKVESANWPDYVFNEDYKISSLAELEVFLRSNRHLPEIPSAETVAQEGISLGEMNGKLLKKIEELTLYLIEQNKSISIQNEKLVEQDKRISLLQTEINAIKKEK